MRINLKRIFNFILFISLGYFLYLNVKGAFQQISYHHLHIDERQVIETVLNVFQVTDQFNRFESISNNFFKSILTILGEILIGGNLDFGRLYKNIFVFFAGPFYFLDTTAVIIVERFIQISFFYASIIYFSIHFVNKDKRLFFMIASFSIPGAYYIIENPKPDSLIVFFLLVAFKKVFVDSKYESAFLFVGIAVGLKIISIVPGIILGIYLIYPLKKINNLNKFIKTIFYTILGVFIAQPALLIPSQRIYSRIISANIAASRYNQEKFFSLNFENMQMWFVELSHYYNLPRELFYVLYAIVIYEILRNSIKSINKISNFYLISFFIVSCFILLNVERIWIYYLAFPTFFLVFYIFSLTDLKTYSLKFFTVLLLIFCISGLNTHHEKTSNTTFSIDNKKEETMYQALSFIQSEYQDQLNIYNAVYWDPDFYFPRQNVTYLGNFRVLENWEQGIELEPLYSSVDFIVSQKKFQINNNKVVMHKIDNLYIYFINEK